MNEVIILSVFTRVSKTAMYITIVQICHCR